MPLLSEQVILITGASTGIGRALALRCAREGGRLALAARSPDNLKAAAAAAVAAGSHVDHVLAIPTDVGDSRSVAKMVDTALSTYGRIDILVNNAGLNAHGTVSELSEADWDRVLNANLKGPFLCSRAVLPHMLERGSGQILFVSSQMSLRGYAGSAAYCAAKGGLNLLAESLREEVGRQGIRVLVSVPGLTQTDFGGRPATEKTAGMRPESVAELILQQLTAPADTLPIFFNIVPQPRRRQ